MRRLINLVGIPFYFVFEAGSHLYLWAGLELDLPYFTDQ
jgi:hypothetical protein